MCGNRDLDSDGYTLNGYPICGACWPEAINLLTALPHREMLTMRRERQQGRTELNKAAPLFDEIENEFASFM